MHVCALIPLIDSNNVHDNNVLIRNTPAPGDDFGAIAIAFFSVTDSPGTGPVASNNTLTNNQGPSHDYGRDGGAFEIYQSSNITMSGNTIVGNDDVVETGTGSSAGLCLGNRFLNNRATGVTGSTYDLSTAGMVLRCAENMLIQGNTFTSYTKPVFDISTSGSFAGSVNGLSIRGNTVTRTLGQVYALEVNVSSQLSATSNTYNWSGTFALDWQGQQVANLAAWQALTGLDRSSVPGS